MDSKCCKPPVALSVIFVFLPAIPVCRQPFLHFEPAVSTLEGDLAKSPRQRLLIGKDLVPKTLQNPWHTLMDQAIQQAPVGVGGIAPVAGSEVPAVWC